MPSFDLICLANSRKLSARCIAGLRTDTGEWVRPVSQAEHGELTYPQRSLGADGEPQNFDVIRVGFAKATPIPSQPENWLVDGTTWKLVDRPAPSSLYNVVRDALYLNDHLFGSLSDRIDALTFSSQPAKESLALVKPGNLRWLVDSFWAKKKARVLFRVGNADYNLALTDPPFENGLKKLELGYHRSKELGIPDENRILFTISLGEAFEGYCYKLVAAVLTLPAAWPDTQ